MDIVSVLTKFSEWFDDELRSYEYPNSSWPSSAEFLVMISLCDARHRLFAAALKRSSRAQCLVGMILSVPLGTELEYIETCSHVVTEMSAKSARYYKRHMTMIRTMIADELCNNHR